jgi:hypothetical protein
VSYTHIAAIITEIRTIQVIDLKRTIAFITTCTTFGKPVIKKLRNNLIDREYLKEIAALQGAGLQEVVNSNKKSVQAAERVQRPNNNETLEWQ